MSNAKKQTLKANSGNMAEIERVMGSKFAGNAKKPASTGQYFKLGDIYGQKWLADNGLDVPTFRYQARKIFGSILLKVYNEERKNPLTQYDIAVAIDAEKAGTLEIPKGILNKVEIKPETMTAKKAKAKAKKTATKPKAEAPQDSKALDQVVGLLEGLTKNMGDLADRLETLEAVNAAVE